ncbi:MAG: DUF4071 domain-containing protein, partial [Chthoniobacterales bacterium]|nr:DUF4071 domain-containing protein [Chthoniobacterales bacterium]
MPERYRDLAQAFLQHGEPLLAHDVVAEAIPRWPDDVRLRQLLGLALARSGATERAQQIFDRLLDEGQADEETFGILGRLQKDFAARASNVAEQTAHWRQAKQYYEKAYRVSRGIWSGINAATMNLLIGQHEEAARLAQA